MCRWEVYDNSFRLLLASAAWSSEKIILVEGSRERHEQLVIDRVPSLFRVGLGVHERIGSDEKSDNASMCSERIP